MELQAGHELEHGKYRILRLLGRGGMGSVYEAEHSGSKKRVAIKWMHPTRQDGANAMERMQREAQASALVRHPNIVDVFDVVRDEKTVFLVMEYLEGETLKDALARRDLPIHAIIALLLPGMRGIAAAHAQGVIHRDIKPENIFLAREADTPLPVTKILDFGISKLAANAELAPLTDTGIPIGTAFYMSYEQFAGAKDIDGRADVYSFGVVLYEALTGQRPYDGRTLAEVCCKMLEGPPLAPELLCPELPRTLSRLVLWALDRDRETRVPSMEQLILELAPFSTQRGLRAELSSSVPESVSPDQAATEAQLGVPPGGWEAPLDSRAVPDTVGARVRTKAWAAAGLLGLALTLTLTFSPWPDERGARLETRAALPAVPGKTPDLPDVSVPSAPAYLREPTAPSDPLVGAPPAASPTRLPAPAAEQSAPAEPHGSSDAPVARGPARFSGGDAALALGRERLPVSRSQAVSPELSPALSQARAHSQAEVERLTEQLAKCGELRTRWLREQCRDDHRREIADFEEQRELGSSVSGP